MDFSTSNYFDYQKMSKAIEKMENIKNQIKYIEVSSDFYKKIKEEIPIINNDKNNRYFYNIPIKIKKDMKENYKIVYDKEVENGI